MTVKISTASRNAEADAIAALVDGGAGAGVLRIYTGAQPSGPDTAASGTLLAEITLNDPAFAGASSGAIVLDVTPAISDSSANNSGTAGWCRFLSSTEAAGTGLGVIDASVGSSGSGADLILSSTSVTSGGTVSITSFTFTAPAS